MYLCVWHMIIWLLPWTWSMDIHRIFFKELEKWFLKKKCHLFQLHRFLVILNTCKMISWVSKDVCGLFGILLVEILCCWYLKILILHSKAASSCRWTIWEALQGVHLTSYIFKFFHCTNYIKSNDRTEQIPFELF